MSNGENTKNVIGALANVLKAANTPDPVKRDVVTAVEANVQAIAASVVASPNNPITSQYHAEQAVKQVVNNKTLTQDPLLGSKRVALVAIAGLTAAVQAYNGDWKSAVMAGLLAALAAWSKVSDGRPVG